MSVIVPTLGAALALAGVFVSALLVDAVPATAWPVTVPSLMAMIFTLAVLGLRAH